jgi:hypothetical protein
MTRPGPKPTPMAERLLKRSYRTESGCLVWDGSVGSTGYGQLPTSHPKRSVVAHRAAYEAWIGPIPDGLQIDHLCRNRRCIEPTHLEAVTPRENLLRSSAPNAIAARRSTCKNGHEWTDATTYRTKKGSRVCRTCHRLYERARYQPRKAA